MDTIAVKILAVMVIIYIPYYIIAKKISYWAANKFFKEDKNENRDR